MRKVMTLEALRQAEIEKLSFEDIFLSARYKADLQGLIQTACQRVGYRGTVVLHTFFDEKSPDDACTDGTGIHRFELGEAAAKQARAVSYLYCRFGSARVRSYLLDRL